MKPIKLKKHIWWLIGILICLLLCIIGYQIWRKVKPTPPGSVEPSIEGEREKEIPEAGRSPNAVWGVYWDGDIAEVLSRQYSDSDFILFGAYFDSNDKIFIQESLETLRDMTRECVQGRTYLSFVNDIQYNDGTTSQKDPELLKRLLQSEDSREEIIASMLEITEEWNCDGIEIDFENIKVADIWGEYIHFLEQLIDAAKDRGIDVRVVLGVDTPADKYSFPAGAEYVIMCYNLYGYHSGPGPKADREFLKGVVERYRNLESVHFALANGGFLWDETDTVKKSLTGQAVSELLQETGAVPQRDEDSYALHFTFKDESGSNTVWYADDVTLAKWAETIEEIMGDATKTDLWRVEGKRKEM